MEEIIEQINKYLEIENIDKPKAKKLQKLYKDLTGKRYGGCLCSPRDRKELQEYIKNNL
jgi:hypothetical protein